MARNLDAGTGGGFLSAKSVTAETHRTLAEQVEHYRAMAEQAGPGTQVWKVCRALVKDLRAQAADIARGKLNKSATGTHLAKFAHYKALEDSAVDGQTRQMWREMAVKEFEAAYPDQTAELKAARSGRPAGNRRRLIAEYRAKAIDMTLDASTRLGYRALAETLEEGL